MLLVIGIGNPTRRDDGAGVEAARRLLETGLEGVEVRLETQLDTTLSDELPSYDALLVLDADPKARRVKVQEALSDSEASSTHQLQPGALRFLTRSLHGKDVRVWTCHIPARDFGFGEGLSETAAAGAAEACEKARRWVLERQGQAATAL